VNCIASNACSNANIGDSAGQFGEANPVELVTVSGYRGAAEAVFDGVAEIRATGSEALASATIYSNGIAEMVVALSGQGAGSDAVINCQGSQCTILCNGMACDGLEVWDIGGAQIEFGTGSTVQRMEDLDCWSSPGQIVQSAAGDEVMCPLIVIVDALESEMARNVVPDDAVLGCDDAGRLRAESIAFYLCIEEEECSGQSFNGGDYAQCSGLRGCSNALFTEVGGAYCFGRESCRSGQLTHGAVTCGGKDSCEYMQYGDAGEVAMDCNGNGACVNVAKDVSWADSDWAQKDRQGGTSDSNDGSQEFACRGYQSCDSAELLHVSVCSGAKSCDYLIMDKTPNVECTADSACILAWFYDNEGSIACDGNGACINGRLFKSDNLYCDGYNSCLSARIYGPNVLYARGENSMDGAVINSCHTQGCDQNPGDTARDITVYAFGKNAMSGSSLRCYGGSTCNVHCHGDACEGLQYICYGGAVCNCDGPGCTMIGEEELEIKEGEKGSYAFTERVGVNAVENLKFDEPVMMVAAGSMVVILMAMFYFCGRERKEEYKVLQ